jgi:hypothetical protein
MVVFLKLAKPKKRDDKILGAFYPKTLLHIANYQSPGKQATEDGGGGEDRGL